MTKRIMKTHATTITTIIRKGNIHPNPHPDPYIVCHGPVQSQFDVGAAILKH